MKKTFILVAMPIIASLFAACTDDRSDLEKAADKVSDALDEVREEVRDAVEEVQEEVKDVGEDVKEAVEKSQ